MKDRIIRNKELCHITGLSRSTLYRLERKGELPRRIKISSNTVGWSLAAIQKWIEGRPAV